MSFSDNPILESYYSVGVVPAVESVGLTCVRIDQEHFSGRVTDQIWREIEACQVVIVDLTEDRPNCYFEAGFAFARGKPLVFQRLNAPGYEAKFEFDVKDFPHIVYTTVDDLSERLAKRLEGLLAYER